MNFFFKSQSQKTSVFQFNKKNKIPGPGTYNPDKIIKY